MNKELFDSMQEQMKPAPEVRAALSEKLAQPVRKRPVPWMKYGAVAACAALVIGGFSVYSLRQNPEAWMLITKNFKHDAQVQNFHSYVVVDGLTETVTENTTVTGNDRDAIEILPIPNTGGGEGGDQDMGMTPDDLTQAMLEVGYTQEEIDEYQSIGYQMTWAKWWKFVGEQQNSEGDDPFNLDNLKAFSQQELYVNTGALPGGAYVGDAPVQEEAVNAYEKLMNRFNGTYPDWYGGAYIDNSATLIVCLVEDKDPGDKTLELQVMDWTDNGRVAFTDVKYSLRYLHSLQDKVVDAMLELDLFAGCGADEELNRLDLTLTSVTYEALAILAQLDPDDDAILVKVGQRATADVGEVVTTDSARTENPVSHDVTTPGGVVPPVREDDAIADEPWVDDVDGAHYDVENLPAQLPQSKQPAVVDSAPEEDDPLSRPVHGPDTSAFTPAYDPNVGLIYPNA